MNTWFKVSLFCIVTFYSCKQDPNTNNTMTSGTQSANNAQIMIDKSPGKVTLSPRNIELGVIERGVPLTVKTVLYNGKAETIQIEKVITTCGCVETYQSKDSLVTGDTALITATYDAKIPGMFSKEVNVRHTHQDTLMNFTISGHVKQ